jgi:NAD-dependent SIR2 family protein deacetylase
MTILKGYGKNMAIRCNRCHEKVKKENDKKLKNEYAYFCKSCYENLYSFETYDDKKRYKAVKFPIYKKDIFVYVTFQGAYSLEIRVNDRLHKMQYMGYTLKKAKDMFIEQVKGYYE